MRSQRRTFTITTCVVVGMVSLTTGALLLWSSGRLRQLQKPVMDGRPITYWLERMASGDDEVEIRRRLVSLGPPVVPPLLAALDDRPSPLKLKATRLLWGRFPAVDKWLWRRRYSSRDMAAYTLAAMPPEPRIRDGLIRALSHARNKEEDSDVGFHAVAGLRDQYTNDWATVVPALRRALRVPHDNIQAAAARALPSFGSHANPAIPELISLSSSSDSYLAAHTAIALGDFGTAASNAAPVLQRLLTNADPVARRCAAVALWKIVPQSGFPDKILLWNMKNGNLQERCKAAQQLWQLDHHRNLEAVEALLAVIASEPDTIDTTTGKPFNGPRWTAAETLGKMGADAETALPALSAIAMNDGEIGRASCRE